MGPVNNAQTTYQPIFQSLVMIFGYYSRGAHELWTPKSKRYQILLNFKS